MSERFEEFEVDEMFTALRRITEALHDIADADYFRGEVLDAMQDLRGRARGVVERMRDDL